MNSFLKISIYFFISLALWTLLAWFLANYLIIEKPLDKANAILVLAGSSSYIERTQEAAKAFKDGIAPKIFLTNDGLRSGWDQKEQRNPYFAERAQWELIRQGVPEESIEILPRVVEGTNEEADLLVSVAAERDLKSLLLVTSAYHSRRALWVFQRVVLRNNLLLNLGVRHSSDRQQLRTTFWWGSNKGWKTVGLELIKMTFYRLVY